MDYSLNLNINSNAKKILGDVRTNLNLTAKSSDKTEQSFERLDGTSKSLSNSLRSTSENANKASTSFSRSASSSSQMNRGLLTLAGSVLGVNRGLARMASSVGLAFAIGGAIRSSVRGLVELEQTQLRLGFLMGRNGEKAQEALQKVQDFAVKSPFALADANAGFENLLKQGLNPNIQQLSRLGDIATFSGKSFAEFTDILGRAQELDLSALDEIGIKAEQVGDQIQVSFNGQTEVIDGNSEAIRNYVMALSETSLVAGAMGEANETTGGKINALSNQFTLLTQQLGEAFRPMIDWVIEGLGWLTQMIQNLTIWVQENWSWMGAWVQVIGRLTLALGAAWAALKIFRFGKRIIMSVVSSFGFLTKAINIAKLAQIAFNAVARISPFGWIAIAVGAISSLFGVFKAFGNFLYNTFKPILDPILWVFEKIGELVDWIITPLKWLLGIEDEKMADIVSSVANEQLEKNEKLREKTGLETFSDVEGKEQGMVTGRASSIREQAGLGLGIDANTGGVFGKINETTADSDTGGVSAGLSQVSGASSQQRNVVININSLVEQFIVNNTDGTVDEEEIREMITRTLLSAMNDVNNS